MENLLREYQRLYVDCVSEGAVEWKKEEEEEEEAEEAEADCAWFLVNGITNGFLPACLMMSVGRDVFT